MAEIRHLQSDEELTDEAGIWIARLNAETVPGEVQVAFENWKGAHPRHARAYDEVAKTWTRLEDMGVLVRAVGLGQDFGRSAPAAIREYKAARSRGRRAVLAAAALAAAACLGWWASTGEPDTVFQTGIGEHATIKLPDGSALDLNSNSLARVLYSAHARVIRLERGEAYFEVKPDVKRPFWVSAEKSWVGAVGTAFNVDVHSTGVRVTVSEGAVKVAANQSATLPPSPDVGQTSVSFVKAGEQLSVRGLSTDIRSLAPAQISRSVDWRRGSIYFKEERLAEVVAELNRYTKTKIVIQDDNLDDLGIGGNFETNEQGAQALLTALQEGFGLQVRTEGRSAYISQQ